MQITVIKALSTKYQCMNHQISMHMIFPPFSFYPLKATSVKKFWFLDFYHSLIVSQKSLLKNKNQDLIESKNFSTSLWSF